MQRIVISPRKDWQKKVEEIGFGFHTADTPYWNEGAMYKFTMKEVLEIEKATGELWDMCLGAVQYVMDNDLYDKFCIPKWIIPHIEKSWENDSPAIYGRFDFLLKDGVPKMLEFNADTPTSLFEGGVVQWYWLQDFDKSKDQFNSIHEKLIAYWKYLKPYLQHSLAVKPHPLYFTCLKETLEDLTTTEYLRDCAIQAGLGTKLIYIDDIGWNEKKKVFVDLENNEIFNIFKLYPWEFLVTEDFGKHIIEDKNAAFWIEPSWKMILSNKAILPILWELYSECPYLLPSHFDESYHVDYVKKPILSREGANILIVKDGKQILKTEGQYAEGNAEFNQEAYIYQEFCEVPSFDGNTPVIGSWVIGQQAAGMGIRETATIVTDNFSRFVPHIIED